MLKAPCSLQAFNLTRRYRSNEYMRALNKTLLSVALVTVTISQAGCSWLGIRDRSHDYLLAEEMASVVVPAGLDDAALGQIYPVPEVASDDVALDELDVPRPDPAAFIAFEQSVKIQSYEDRRWILVNQLPGEIWPRLRSTLVRNGIPAEVADGERGIIDSVWVKFNDDEEMSHRFRFSVIPGIAQDSTEISVLHQSVARGAEQGVEWPQKSVDGVRERALIQMVANELASASNYSSVSLLAQTIGGKGRVELITPEVADPYILIQLNFDRSWASMSYSAQRGGFTIVDQNRSGGSLLVDFTDGESEQRSFWQRWFSSDEIIVSDYQLLLKAVGANVEVRITAVDGSSLPRKEAQRLLAILRSNMS